jgi:Tfp pilus assembly protein PilO
MAELRSRHPSAPHEAEFLARLTQRAEQFQVTLRDFRPGSISDRGGAKEIELSLSLMGDYENICRYLDALQDLPRACRVQQLTISSPPAAGERCSGELKLGLLFAAPGIAGMQLTGVQP